MDWDELEPKKKTGIAVGDDLSMLSVDELRDRIEALKEEIVRVEEEMEKKASTMNAANDAFKN